MEYKVQEHLHYAGIASWNHCEVTQDVEGADIVIMGVRDIQTGSTLCTESCKRTEPNSLLLQVSMGVCFEK